MDKKFLRVVVTGVTIDTSGRHPFCRLFTTTSFLYINPEPLNLSSHPNREKIFNTIHIRILGGLEPYIYKRSTDKDSRFPIIEPEYSKSTSETSYLLSG